MLMGKYDLFIIRSFYTLFAKNAKNTEFTMLTAFVCWMKKVKFK